MTITTWLNDRGWWRSALWVVAAWLFARPYSGIWHDGVVYAIQGLRIADPAVYGRDLFFYGQTQGQFTLYPRLYGFLIGLLGLGTAAQFLTFFSVPLFLAAAYGLFSRLISRESVWLGLLVLAVFPHLYGANQAFAFAETFATARSLAEPLSLAGLAAMMRDKRVLAAVLLLAAALLHPLIALPCIVVVLVALVIQDWRFLALPALVIMLVVVLAVYGVSPFSDLLRVIDVEWWRGALQNDPTLFLSSWNAADWNVVVFDGVVLSMVVRRLPREKGAMAKSVLLSTAVALGATALLADGLHLLLPTRLQFWRFLWLSHCFAMMLVPWLFLELRRTGRECAGLLVLAALVLLKYTGVAILLPLAWFLDSDYARVAVLAKANRFNRILYGVIGCCGLFPVLSWAVYGIDDSLAGIAHLGSLLFSVPLLAFVLTLGAGWVCSRHGTCRSAVLGSILLSAIALGQWDARSDLRREIESYQGNEGVFAEVKPGQQVFWYDNPVAVWSLTKTVSYYSPSQCAGVVFSQRTTEECSRRVPIDQQFDRMAQECGEQAMRLGREVICLPSAVTLSRLCKTFSDLDYLVLDGNVNQWAVAQWQPRSGKHPFFLHRCAAIRQNGEPQTN